MNINGYEVKDGVLDLSGVPVTKLENKAFLAQRSIRDVIMPPGITYIGDWAFAKCSNLRSVHFTCNHRPGLFGRNVFDGCDKLEIIDFTDVPDDTGRLLAACANALPYDHMIRSDDVGHMSWYEKWDICLAAKLKSDNAEAGINAALCGEEDISYDGIGSVDGEMPGEIDDYLRREEHKKCGLCYLRLSNDRYLMDSTRELIRAYIIENRFGSLYSDSFYSVFDEGGDTLQRLRLYLDIVGPDKEVLKEMTGAVPHGEVYARSYLIKEAGGKEDSFDALLL